MQIFYEGNQIRLQLMDIPKGIMLFDFKINESDFKELKNHIIEHLNAFKLREGFKEVE